MVEFRKGDLVRLKSGGPEMTVLKVSRSARLLPSGVKAVTKSGLMSSVAYDGDFVVSCVWFNGLGNKFDDSFDPEVLVKI